MIDNGLYVDKPRIMHSAISSLSLVSGSSILLANASAKRVGLIVSALGAANLAVLNNRPITGTTDGFPLTGGFPYEFYDWTSGDIVSKPWFIFGAGGTFTVGIIEVMRD